MQFNVFFVPIKEPDEAQKELNHFLRTKRILAVKQEFADTGWTFCVEWLEGASQTSRKMPKVDYREVLSPEQFDLFSKLRDKRKQLASRDGVQVYTIMTNEQLAELVRKKINTIEGFKEISGVGESRLKKYGMEFIKVIEENKGMQN
jgi:superfamily II DNA helicase RecQ